MSVGKLIKHFSSCVNVPLDIDEDVVPIVRSLGIDDEIYTFWDADLDPAVMRGRVEQWEYPRSEHGPMQRVTEITYSKNQENEWQRLVCCKELMHMFDKPFNRADTESTVERLIEKIVMPADLQDPLNDGPHANIDRVAVLMAVAVLFPLAARALLLPAYEEKKKTIYDIAELVELPPRYVAVVMSDVWPEIHELLIGF